MLRPQPPGTCQPSRGRHAGENRSPKKTRELAVDYSEVKFGEAIGAGSFGAVWAGTFRGSAVAIKQCKVGSREEAAQLSSEIGFLSQLRHPRLVSVVGFCDHTPHVVMLMELMTGGSLYHALFGPKARPFSFQLEMQMAGQIAEGLAYLHARSVVHRDLKTLNIVLDKALNCKLCDFGLAVTLERSHLTVAGMTGSPRYMAPELLDPPAKVTEKVDIWAMGCVLLELFCRSTPFAHCSGVLQLVAELVVHRRAPSVPAGADVCARALISACLRMAPKARPTAGALESALGRLALATAAAPTPRPSLVA